MKKYIWNEKYTDEINSKLGIVKEKISEFEYISIKNL